MSSFFDAVAAGSHAAVGGTASTSDAQVPVVFEFAVASGSAAQTKVVPYSVQITHAFCVKGGTTGGSSDAVAVGTIVAPSTGSNGIMSFNLSGSAAGEFAAKAPSATTYTTLAKGDSLLCSGTQGTSDECTVYVYGLLRG